MRVDGSVTLIECYDGDREDMICPDLSIQIGSPVTYRYTFDKEASATPGPPTNYYGVREGYIRVGDYSVTVDRTRMGELTANLASAMSVRNTDIGGADGNDEYSVSMNTSPGNAAALVPGIENLPLEFIGAYITLDKDYFTSEELVVSPIDLTNTFEKYIEISFTDHEVQDAGVLGEIRIRATLDTMQFSEITFRASGTVMQMICGMDGTSCSLGPLGEGASIELKYTFDSAAEGVGDPLRKVNYYSMREIFFNIGTHSQRIDRDVTADLIADLSGGIGIQNNALPADRYSVGINVDDGRVSPPLMLQGRPMQFIGFEIPGNINLLMDNSLPITPPDLSNSNEARMEIFYGPNSDLIEARVRLDSLAKSGLPETPIGENVVIDPPTTNQDGSPVNNSPVSLTFENVTSAGQTSVTLTPSAPPVPPTLKLGNPAVFYDLQSTATFIDSVEICIDYREFSFDDETTLTMLHFTDPDGPGPQFEQWVDVTTVLDNDNGIICGSTDSFSPFAIVEENIITGSGTIGNFIWNDINQNGIQNSGEPGLEGVSVALEDCDGNELTSITSDANGQYLFENLMMGSYRVRFTVPAGFSFSPRLVGLKRGKDSDANVTTGLSNCLAMPDDKLRLGVDAGLMMQVATSKIGNFVWNDVNANGIKDAGEIGAGGVTVKLQDCSGNVLKTKTTQTNGKYIFNDLTAGRYKVKFEAPNGMSLSPAFQGNRRGRDSDPNPGTGLTSCRFIPAGVARLGVDAGLIN